MHQGHLSDQIQMDLSHLTSSRPNILQTQILVIYHVIQTDPTRRQHKSVQATKRMSQKTHQKSVCLDVNLLETCQQQMSSQAVLDLLGLMAFEY